MPLGAARLSFLAKSAAAAATGRTAKTFITVKDPEISTVQSKFGGASALFQATGQLNGTSDCVRTNQSSDFIFTGDFTWECWVYLVDNGTSDGYILMANRGGFNATNLYVQARQSDNKWQWGNSTMGANITSQTWSYNTWYHVAVVRNGTSNNNFALYVNGSRLQQDTDTNTIGSSGYSDYISMGSIYNASTPTFGLNGYLDEVRVSPIARYTGSNYTVPTAPFVNDDDTVLLVHMDGTDGSTAFVDDNGVDRSQVGISAVGDAQISTAQSKFGGASAVFDGSGDHLEMSTFELDGDYTVECWARWDTVSGSQGLIGSDGTTQYDTLKSFGNEVYTNFGNVFIEFDSTISANTWYHIAVTRSGSSVRLFRDGVQQGSTATDTTTVWPNASNTKVYVGRDAYGDIDGYVDEVRISNTARYTSGFTPSTTAFENDENTLLLLHMDGTNGSTTFTDDNGVY